MSAIRDMRDGTLLRATGNVLLLCMLCATTSSAQGQSPNPARVSLTGIVGIVKPPRVLLEVEQAGQTSQKLSLREGEREGAIELVSIDAAKNRVRIRNAGVEQELSFVSNRAQLATTPPTATTRIWDAAKGKPVEPAGNAPAVSPPAASSAPIVIGARSDDRAPRVPDVTVVGRRQRTIPSMLGPRFSGPSQGHEGFQAALPIRDARTDGRVDAQPQPLPPQPPLLPPLPQPGQPPAPEPTAEMPVRRLREALREIQLAEPAPYQRIFDPPDHSKAIDAWIRIQQSPAPPPPVAAPELPPANPGVVNIPTTQPGYRGGYVSGAHATVGSLQSLQFQSGGHLGLGDYTGYDNPGLQWLPPATRQFPQRR